MFENVSLDNFRRPTFEIREVGRVEEVRKAVASIVGLPSCLYGQTVNFPNDLKGMVIGFNEQKVTALILGDDTRIKSGDEVHGKQEPFKVPVGKAFVGRVVDSLSRPRDGRGKIEADDAYPVFRVAPGGPAAPPCPSRASAPHVLGENAHARLPPPLPSRFAYARVPPVCISVVPLKTATSRGFDHANSWLPAGWFWRTR